MEAIDYICTWEQRNIYGMFAAISLVAAIILCAITAWANVRFGSFRIMYGPRAAGSSKAKGNAITAIVYVGVLLACLFVGKDFAALTIVTC